MIISMGIDIVEIVEIKKAIEKSNRFIERVYTPKEIEYCKGKIDKYSHYAARYAAKEAVMKALGTGWDKGVQWKQVETVNTKIRRSETGDGKPDAGSGKPEIRLNGEALKRANEMRVNKIVISLSHSQYYAVANVIFEGD